MITSYTNRIVRDHRWNKAVDFGSPMTAWTPAMLREWRSRKAKEQQAAKKKSESLKES